MGLAQAHRIRSAELRKGVQLVRLGEVDQPTEQPLGDPERVRLGSIGLEHADHWVVREGVRVKAVRETIAGHEFIVPEWRRARTGRGHIGTIARGRRHESAMAAKIRRVAQSLPKVVIQLLRSDAVVLFDWLMSVDLNAVPINHPAEKQALADLLTRLEETDVAGVTQPEIDAARAEVARDMGW